MNLPFSFFSSVSLIKFSKWIYKWSLNALITLWSRITFSKFLVYISLSISLSDNKVTWTTISSWHIRLTYILMSNEQLVKTDICKFVRSEIRSSSARCYICFTTKNKTKQTSPTKRISEKFTCVQSICLNIVTNIFNKFSPSSKLLCSIKLFVTFQLPALRTPWSYRFK